MTNIFENAYFGKLYRTRDEKKAIYLECFRDMHFIVIQGRIDSTPVYSNGKFWKGSALSPDDIVSEWHEKIDKETIKKQARKAYSSAFKDDKEWDKAVYCKGYEAGYCEAKQE